MIRRGGDPEAAMQAAVAAAQIAGGSEQAQARAKAAAEIVAMDVRGRGTYVGVLKEGEVDAAVLTAQIKDAGERLEAARAHVAAKEEALPTHLKVSGALEDLRQAEVVPYRCNAGSGGARESNCSPSGEQSIIFPILSYTACRIV